MTEIEKLLAQATETDEAQARVLASGDAEARYRAVLALVVATRALEKIANDAMRGPAAHIPKFVDPADVEWFGLSGRWRHVEIGEPLMPGDRCGPMADEVVTDPRGAVAKGACYIRRVGIVEVRTEPNAVEMAHRMFVAYNSAGERPWQTFDGRPVPTWEQLTDDVRAKWTAAAAKARDLLRGGA